MNAEHMHQLYGGDIVDHYNNSKPIDFTKVSHGPDIGQDIANIYNTQVKTKGAIDTSNLLAPNINLSSLMDQRPPDPFQTMLNDTLSKIATEIGLEGEPGVSVRDIKSILTPKMPDQVDIHHAQDSVARALAELKDLGAA